MAPCSSSAWPAIPQATDSPLVMAPCSSSFASSSTHRHPCWTPAQAADSPLAMAPCSSSSSLLPYSSPRWATTSSCVWHGGASRAPRWPPLRSRLWMRLHPASLCHRVAPLRHRHARLPAPLATPRRRTCLLVSCVCDRGHHVLHLHFYPFVLALAASRFHVGAPRVLLLCNFTASPPSLSRSSPSPWILTSSSSPSFQTLAQSPLSTPSSSSGRGGAAGLTCFDGDEGRWLEGLRLWQIKSKLQGAKQSYDSDSPYIVLHGPKLK
jgi:hypothetical protein